MQIALVLALLAAALILFPLELISVDLVAMSVLFILIVTGILSPQQAFASFGSEMIVLLASIFLIAGILLRTGILDSVGVWLYRHCGGSYRFLLFSIMSVVCTMSAFMNNTVVTAVFVPVVLAIARRAQLPPSKILIPVAFASLLGGCCTLIGTSTNLAASNFLIRKGMEPFSLFEFAPVGIILAVAGIIFFFLLGSRLLPTRSTGELTRDYHVKEYLTEVAILEGCPFIDKRVDDAGFQEFLDITILGILRGDITLLAPEGHEKLETDDILLIKGNVEAIQKLRQATGVELKGDVVLGDTSLESESVRLVEVMVGPGSRFLGRSLQEIDFRRRFGLTVLAIHRLGVEVVEKVGKIPLLVGDVLLVQGPERRLEDLRTTGNVLLLSDLSRFLLEKRKGLYVVSFFVLALAAGALNLLPLETAVLGAAVLSVLVRAIPTEEVYRVIDWRMLMLIGAMTGFGQAMVNTGADKFMADLMLMATSHFGIHGILLGFFVLTTALSQPLSNAAAALAVLPVALATAEQLGVNPRTFAVVVTMAASASFIAPLEPCCLLVYPVGRYRFVDFVIAGGPLTVVFMIVILLLVPVLWPL